MAMIICIHSDCRKLDSVWPAACSMLIVMFMKNNCSKNMSSFGTRNIPKDRKEVIGGIEEAYPSFGSFVLRTPGGVQKLTTEPISGICVFRNGCRI